jgi:hypothetical protein
MPDRLDPVSDDGGGLDLIKSWHYSTVGIKITAGSLRWHLTAGGMRVSRVSP